MDTVRFSTQCKVRLCSQCQRDTEFFCNTCKHDLCQKCKEKHVIDLDIKHHDVVIFREKYENISQQETCVRHPDKIYEMFCNSCELPLCLQCKGHKKHQILDIRSAYKTNRQQHRKIIHNIRSETLYGSCSFLAGIKNNIETCHRETAEHQLEMSTKARKLKYLIDSAIFYTEEKCIRYKFFVLPGQKIKMKKYLASIENYEHRAEQSARRPVEFLLFLKKVKIEDTPCLSQHALVSITEEINMEHAVKLLTDFQIIKRRERHVRKEFLLGVLSSPALHKSVTVSGVIRVTHISQVTSDRVWISDRYTNLILTNAEGDTLHHLTDINSYYTGVHTVTKTCDLIYIDKNNNIKKLSKDNRTKPIPIEETEPWMPVCVYCSPIDGNLLVGMINTDTETAMITRNNYTGLQLQAIQYNKKRQQLYRYPLYITENRNGDVIVSDVSDIVTGYGAVVVTEYRGKHRFSYTGPPSGSGLQPRGICTDALSHILVCDWNNHTVQMIDKDGTFLTLIKTQQQGIEGPYSLSYDNKSRFLWVGSYNDNKICVYRYINRLDYMTENRIGVEEFKTLEKR